MNIKSSHGAILPAITIMIIINIIPSNDLMLSIL